MFLGFFVLILLIFDAVCLIKSGVFQKVKRQNNKQTSKLSVLINYQTIRFILYKINKTVRH